MMGLLVFKERLREFYATYATYVHVFVKFGVSSMAFYLINENIGFVAALKNPLVPFAAGIICSLLPFCVIACLTAAFMLIHIYSVSLELALIAFALILIIALLYYGFEPGDSCLLILTPMMFFFKIPYVIPLIVGLGGSLISVLPVSCGVFIYYLMNYVKQNAGVLMGDTSLDITKKYGQVLKAMIGNQLMLLMILTVVVGILIVHTIRSFSVDYAWLIAIVAGTLAQLGVIFVGSSFIDVSISFTDLIIGISGSAFLAGIYHFFVFVVDYTRTEYLQYEDDDYYYYVKAVPKIVISKPDVKVKKINARNRRR